MTDMSKYNVVGGSDGEDLKASAPENQGKSYKFTITKVGEVTYPPGDFSDVPVTKSTLYFAETDKKMVVRPKNNEHLCEKYGVNSDGWIGKTIGAESEAWTSNTGSGWMWTVRALEVEFDSVAAPSAAAPIPNSEPDFDDSLPF